MDMYTESLIKRQNSCPDMVTAVRGGVELSADAGFGNSGLVVLKRTLYIYPGGVKC